jgi:hypothetical protein
MQKLTMTSSAIIDDEVLNTGASIEIDDDRAAELVVGGLAKPYEDDDGGDQGADVAKAVKAVKEQAERDQKAAVEAAVTKAKADAAREQEAAVKKAVREALAEKDSPATPPATPPDADAASKGKAKTGTAKAADAA